MAELTWIVSNILDCNGKPCDWVVVSPTGGTGSSTPTITINEGVDPNDCEEAYVYISASTKEEQIIPITRCVPECSCKSMGYTAVKYTNVSSDGGTIQIGTYNKDIVCAEKASVEIDGIVLTSYTMSNGVITADVSAYDNTEQGRTGWFKFYYDGIVCSEGNKVSQGQGQDACDVIGCPEGAVTPSTIVFGTEGGTENFSLPNMGDCFDVNYSVSSSWVNVDLKNGTISAERNSSVSNERTATVKFVFTNLYTYEECPRRENQTITVRQAHDLRDCDCNDLIFESIEPEPEECSVGVKTSGRLSAEVSQQMVRIGTYESDCNGEPNITVLEGIEFFYINPSEGVLYARPILRNSATNGRSTRCKMTINGTDSNEFYIYQNGQQSGPVDACDNVDENPALTEYLSVIRTSIGLNQNITNTGKTKCTYSYLSWAYDYASENCDSNVGIAWVLANVIAELLPGTGKETTCFKNLADRYGGNKLPYDSETDLRVYNERIDASLVYAQFKRQDYVQTTEAANLARTELYNNFGFGMNSGRLLNIPSFSSQKISVNASRLIVDVPSNKSGSTDFRITQDFINEYPITSTDSRFMQAKADKDESDEYLCNNVFNLNYDSRRSNFFSYCSEFTRQANGVVKWDFAYERWRPGAFQKITQNKFTGNGVTVSNGVYVADGDYDYYSYTSACGACGGCGRDCPNDSRCNGETCVGGYDCQNDCSASTSAGVVDACPSKGMNSHQSYPSGHSMKSYFFFLACVEANGIDGKKQRVMDYCENREIVRAHWHSDVIAGKYSASMQIGFINGVQQFHDKMPYTA